MSDPLVILKAGTVGGSFQSYQFTEPGKYLITGGYEHFEIPDTTKLQLNGQTIFSSGRLSPGGFTFAESFELKEGETATLAFLVDAPFVGTAWNYNATITRTEPKPPVAVDDSERNSTDSEDAIGEGFRVTKDAPFRFTEFDFLGNDSDPDNDLDRNSIVIASQPTHGTVTFENGFIFYTPDFEALKAAGRDSFTYTVKDKTGLESNVATVFLEGPCSPPYPYVISGGTVEELGDGTCRTTGNFYIGRADGESRLIFVQNGVAEYNKDKLDILSGRFSSAVGPEPVELFTLTEKLTFLRNKTSAVDLVLPTQGDVALGGIPFQITNIALDKTEIDLGGGLILPTPIGGQELQFGGFNAIGGAPFGAKITALSIGPEGVSVEGGEIALKDLKYRALFVINVKSEGIKVTFSDNLSSPLPDLTVNGKLSVYGEWLNSSTGTDGTTKDTISSSGLFVDLLAPDFGVKIVDGKISDGKLKIGQIGTISFGKGEELKKDGSIGEDDGFGIKGITGELQFEKGSLVDGKASGEVSFPKVAGLGGVISGISGKLGFARTESGEFGVDDLGLTISGDIPLGASGVSLTKLGGGFENIQPNPPGGLGYNRPLIFDGTIGLGFGSKIDPIPVPTYILPAGEITLRPVSIEVTGGLRRERSDEGTARKGDLSVTGLMSASVGAPEILKLDAKGTLNWTRGGFDISGTVNALSSTFIGAGSLTGLFSTNSSNASLSGDLKVPDLPAFFSYRGKTLDTSRLEAYSAGDTFAINIWKSVVIPKIGAVDIGVRFDTKNGFDPFFGTKPALLVGSWQTQGNEDWLEMVASWDNMAGRDVALRVTYQAVAGGPVIETYEEADFEAAGIVAPLDFSGDYARSVFVNDPRAGVWDVEVIDATGLGNVRYDGFIPAERPEIELLDAKLVPGASGAPTYQISYEAFDPDSAANVVFFVDNDGEGYNGTLLGVAGLVTETDGAGTVTFSTADFRAGAQFVYAMITDGDSAPVFSNYLGPLQGRAATDLALVASGPGPEVETGSWASYRFAIDNLGPETAIDGVLELKFSDLTFLPKGPGPVDPRDGRFFDTMDWRLLGQNDGLTMLGWSRLDTYTTGANGQVVATPNGDWVFKVAVEPLAAGASRTLDIQFQAPDVTTQVLSVEASLSSAGWETDASNETASLFTKLVARQAPTADLSISRVAPDYGPDPVENGTYEYAYVITNNSLEAADGVKLTIELGPEIPLPLGLASFYYQPAFLSAKSGGFEASDPWTTKQENYRYTISFNRALEGGESVVVPISFKPLYHWTFDDTATVTHAGVDFDTTDNVATGVLDLPPFQPTPTPPPKASLKIIADDYTPVVGDQIRVTASFGASDDVGGQLFRVKLPAGVELLASRTVITIGTFVTDRPVSNEVSFVPDPNNPGSYLWQLADVFTSGDLSLQLDLRVLDASPQPISIEMISSPVPFANVTPGNGVIGEADDATLTLNDPAGPPPPPFVGTTTPPVIGGILSNNPLPLIVEDQFFTYTFAPEAFDAAAPGEPLTISLVSGPSWLSFDPATFIMSGTPDAPTIFGDVTFSATDAEGDTGIGTIRLRVINTPDAPVIARQIADQTVKVGANFALVAPNPQSVGVNGVVETIGIFSDPDFLDRDPRTLVGNDFVNQRDVLTLSFSGLPDWLALDDSDPQMPLLRGLPFADDLGTTTITVTATDIFGLTTTMTFDIEVVANDNPINGFMVTAGSGVVTEGDSGTTIAAITIARFGDASGPASVAWAVAGRGETPVDARDFGGRLPSGLAEFAAGETVKTIELRVRGDLLSEGDEGFQVVLTDAVGAPIALDNAQVTILNDDDEPELGGAATTVGFRSFSDSPFYAYSFNEGEEGITYAVVELQRQGDLSGTTSVTWRLDHNDTNAADFGGTTPRGVAVFEPGQSTAQIRIPISGDTVVETLGQAYDFYPDFGEFGAYFQEGQSPDDYDDLSGVQYYLPFESPFFAEEFNLQIESVEGAVVGKGDFLAAIVNDDQMFTLSTLMTGIRLINPDPLGPGGAEGTTFTFELSTQDFGALTPDSSIAWELIGLGDAPAEAADFNPAVLASGVARFGVGNASTTISVTVRVDGIGEKIEQFAVVLKPLDPASTLYTTSGVAIGTILNAEYGLYNDAASTPAGEAVTIDLLGNDIATPGGGLTLTGFGAAANGHVTFGPSGTAVYTPDLGFSGTDGFTYTTRGADGMIRSANVTVTVAPPVAMVDARNDTAATQSGVAVDIEVLANDTAPGGAALSVVHFGYAGSGEVELTATGLLRYTPAAGFSGLDTIRYSSGDGITEDSATLTVLVGNRAPRIEVDVRETSVVDRTPDAAIRVGDILLGDDGIGEHVFAVSGPDAALFQVIGRTLFLRAGVVLEGRAGETLSVNISVDDTLLPGGPEAVTGFNLDIVSAINAAPLANGDFFRARTEGLQVFDVIGNDRDFDGDLISLVSVAGATKGTVGIVDGKLAYTPFDSVIGDDFVTYSITDGRDTSSGQARIRLVTVLDVAGSVITGTAGNDVISPTQSPAGQPRAGAGGDILYGLAGNDRLDGGTGADTMFGGADNDIYHVDNAGDTVREDSVPGVDDGGIDSVSSSISYALGALVENLTLTGAAAINGTGNTLANRIIGNGGANVLDGGDGNDNLYGGAGADDIRGSNGFDFARYDDAAYSNLVINLANVTLNTGAAAGDSYSGIEGLVGGSGNDTITGNNAANSLIGQGGNDAIFGGGGNDRLSGKAGNDTLDGGAGNDNLYGGVGADDIRGSNGFDFARYDDAAYSDLVINLANVTGNTGAAAGDSYSGIEGLVGGSGNDTITGNNAANSLIGQGGDDAIFGGGGNDRLGGKAGNDTLDGGLGNDSLEGDSGADQFNFTTALNSVTNVDTILNFTVGTDRLGLSQGIFSGIGGTLDEAEFATGTAATTSAHRIVYHSMTGQLSHDADGAGGADAVVFAILPTMTTLTIDSFTTLL